MLCFDRMHAISRSQEKPADITLWEVALQCYELLPFTAWGATGANRATGDQVRWGWESPRAT